MVQTPLGLRSALRCRGQAGSALQGLPSSCTQDHCCSIQGVCLQCAGWGEREADSALGSPGAAGPPSVNLEAGEWPRSLVHPVASGLGLSDSKAVLSPVLLSALVGLGCLQPPWTWRLLSYFFLCSLWSPEPGGKCHIARYTLGSRTVSLGFVWFLDLLGYF